MDLPTVKVEYLKALDTDGYKITISDQNMGYVLYLDWRTGRELIEKMQEAR